MKRAPLILSTAAFFAAFSHSAYALDVPGPLGNGSFNAAQSGRVSTISIATPAGNQWTSRAFTDMARAVTPSGGVQGTANVVARMNVPAGAIAVPARVGLTVAPGGLTSLVIRRMPMLAAGVLASTAMVSLADYLAARWDASSQSWQVNSGTAPPGNGWVTRQANPSEGVKTTKAACDYVMTLNPGRVATREYVQPGYALYCYHKSANDPGTSSESSNVIYWGYVAKFTDGNWAPATAAQAQQVIQQREQASPVQLLERVMAADPDALVDATPTIQTDAQAVQMTGPDGVPRRIVISTAPDRLSITAVQDEAVTPGTGAGTGTGIGTGTGTGSGTGTEQLPETVVPATDPEMPELPTLYERKYPDGLAGVWRDKSEAFKATPFAAAIASLTPNLGDGGCPQWSLPLNLGGAWNFGSFDYSVPCEVWSALRVLMIVFALFVARRLIFGG